MKFNIKGMHCSACKTIIQMEIEEEGLLASKFIRTEIIDEDRKIGTLAMKKLSKDEYSKLKECVEKAGDYKIID